MGFFRRKWKYIAFGLAMGVLAAGINMANMSKGTEAAVLVMDEKNIEQAIEEVIRTTKILNTEQQNLLIQMLQSKKFDISMLEQMMKTSKDNQGFLNDCMGDYKGILGQSTSTESYIRSTIGTVEDIFNGDITVYDGYKLWEKGIKARENAAKDAAATAKVAQEVARNTAKGTAQALENNNKAEGTNELLQVSNELLAYQNDIQSAQLQIEAQQLAVLAANTQQENVEKAQKEQFRRDCIEHINSYDFSYLKEGNNRHGR